MLFDGESRYYASFLFSYFLVMAAAPDAQRRPHKATFAGKIAPACNQKMISSEPAHQGHQPGQGTQWLATETTSMVPVWDKPAIMA